MADSLDRLRATLTDRYAIERELGRGATATVYLATDLRHNRSVALKVLQPELAAVVGPDRFLREIQTTAGLTHPHILPLLDSGDVDGTLFFVMPYVAGESLRERLNKEKQLPLEDALRIAREVADALSYAHTLGVVHRDIKPENILLESGHAVVADFGIARAIDAAGGERLTETGFAIGTPAYMSPEQAAGGKELDGRSDLYSLSCVLYEMLAGKPPFTGPTSESLIYQHLAAEPPNITGIRPAVPANVAAALARALSKTPADRFNPVALFAEALGPGAATATSATPPVRGRLSWERVALLVVVVAVVLAGAVGLWRRMRTARPANHPRTAIAVLPFQNLSEGGPYGYFAGGLHDELLTQLAKVRAFSLVIGRTSLATYTGSSKRPSEIGDELAVGSLVEGSVQVVGDRLRVNVQLIDPITEGDIWAERYDRTLDDAFAVQSEVAQRIVTAVGVALAGTERAAIAAAPTSNAEAYRLYLQGVEYFGRPGNLRSNFEIAQSFFEQSVTLDTTFALAYTALADVHGRMAWFRFDTSPARLDHMREAAEAAMRLAPDLPQSHLAMGDVYYRARQDWRAALKEYRTALEGVPNDPGVWSRIGYANRRLGVWDEAVEALTKAAALDPRDANAQTNLGSTLLFLRRYPEALEHLTRSAALAPDVAQRDVFRGWAWVVAEGRLDSLSAALDRHPENAALGDLGSGNMWRAFTLHRERSPDSLLALLRRVREPIFEAQSFYLPKSLYAAWAHQLRGDGAATHAAFESARVLLDSAVEELPGDWRVHGARGLALAGLGRRQDALQEARWLQQSDFYRDDAFQGSLAVEQRARILAQVGEPDGALDEIERLLAGPAYGFSIHTLRLDPRWDPIRDDPRFQALLDKYADHQAH